MYIHRVVEQMIEGLLEDRKIVILLGARQVGKTTLIEPFVRERKGLLLNCDIAVDKERLLSAGALAPREALQLLGNLGYRCA